MERLFIGTAISQIVLFLTLEFGVKKEILKKDTYMTMAKISCFIITVISIYVLRNAS